MKKAIALVAVVALFSCSKDNDGFMFKASHTYKDRFNKTQVMVDYFRTMSPDSTSASNWYTTTQAYQNISGYTDSTWVEYYCTYQEWIDSGKKGWEIN